MYLTTWPFAAHKFVCVSLSVITITLALLWTYDWVWKHHNISYQKWNRLDCYYRLTTRETLTLWKTQRMIFSEFSIHRSFSFVHICTYSSKKSTKAWAFLPKFFQTDCKTPGENTGGKKFPLGLPWEIFLHISVYTHAYLHVFSWRFYSSLEHSLKEESL